MMAIHIFEVELAAIFLIAWALSVVAMYFIIDRKSRPGLVRSVAVIEGMMLLSILALRLGLTFSIWGAGLAD